MLNAFFPVYLQCLLLISAFSSVYIMQELQPQYARAANDLSQGTHIIPVHAATTSDILANNGDVSNSEGVAGNSSTALQKEQESSATAVKNFQDAFCGIDGVAGNS